MAAITWQDVVDYRAAMSDVHATVQTDALAYANTKLRVSLFDGEDGVKTRIARILLASHFGELALARANAAVAGAVDSETYGASTVTLSYDLSVTSEVLASTIAGAAYLDMLSRSAARVGFAL